MTQQFTKEDYQNVLDRMPFAYGTGNSIEVIKSALQLSISAQPRPIEEYKYPDDGRWVQVLYDEMFIDTAELDEESGYWKNNHGHIVFYPTHFYDLGFLPKPGDGE